MNKNLIYYLFSVFLFINPYHDAQSSVCSSEFVFYKFNKGLGACLTKEIKIEKEHIDDENMAYNIFLKDKKIYMEFSGRLHGDIFLIFGNKFEKRYLKNLSKNNGDNTNQLTWNLGDNQRYSSVMFSDGYSGVFIQSYYSSDVSHYIFEFIDSLFFICSKDQKPQKDNCLIVHKGIDENMG